MGRLKNPPISEKYSSDDVDSSPNMSPSFDYSIAATSVSAGEEQQSEEQIRHDNHLGDVSNNWKNSVRHTNKTGKKKINSKTRTVRTSGTSHLNNNKGDGITKNRSDEIKVMDKGANAKTLAEKEKTNTKRDLYAQTSSSKLKPAKEINKGRKSKRKSQKKGKIYSGIESSAKRIKTTEMSISFNELDRNPVETNGINNDVSQGLNQNTRVNGAQRKTQKPQRLMKYDGNSNGGSIETNIYMKPEGEPSLSKEDFSKEYLKSKDSTEKIIKVIKHRETTDEELDDFKQNSKEMGNFKTPYDRVKWEAKKTSRKDHTSGIGIIRSQEEEAVNDHEYNVHNLDNSLQNQHKNRLTKSNKVTRSKMNLNNKRKETSGISKSYDRKNTNGSRGEMENETGIKETESKRTASLGKEMGKTSSFQNRNKSFAGNISPHEHLGFDDRRRNNNLYLSSEDAFGEKNKKNDRRRFNPKSHELSNINSKPEYASSDLEPTVSPTEKTYKKNQRKNRIKANEYINSIFKNEGNEITNLGNKTTKDNQEKNVMMEKINRDFENRNNQISINSKFRNKTDGNINGSRNTALKKSQIQNKVNRKKGQNFGLNEKADYQKKPLDEIGHTIRGSNKLKNGNSINKMLISDNHGLNQDSIHKLENINAINEDRAFKSSVGNQRMQQMTKHKHGYQMEKSRNVIKQSKAAASRIHSISSTKNRYGKKKHSQELMYHNSARHQSHSKHESHSATVHHKTNPVNDEIKPMYSGTKVQNRRSTKNIKPLKVGDIVSINGKPVVIA